MKQHTFNYFETLGEFLRKIEETPKSLRDSSDGHEGDSWSGGATSVAEAVKLPIEGHSMEFIEAEIGRIYSDPHKSLEPTFDVSGSDIEMGRLMTGVPECMIDFDMTDTKNRFIHIVIGITEGASIDNEQIMRRAAALSSVIDNLENQRFRVRLSLSVGNNGGFDGGFQLTMVDIKHYYEPMNLANISGILHTSFYRRAIFCFWEGHKLWRRDPGYGSPPRGTQSGDALAAHHEHVDADKMLYMPSISEGSSAAEITSDFYDDEEMKRYVKQIVDHIDELSS